MTDDEIYQLCSTEQGCIKYLKENRQNHFYQWSYLDSEKAPILDLILDEGLIEKRINTFTKVEEYRLKENKIIELENIITKKDKNV